MTRVELIKIIHDARVSLSDDGIGAFIMRQDTIIADAIIAKGERLSPGSANFIKSADADTTVHLAIDVQPARSKHSKWAQTLDEIARGLREDGRDSEKGRP